MSLIKTSLVCDDIALIQLDQAGAHVTSALHWPDNLIPVCQPAHSPELNPIERVWQFIKQQFKGEVFLTSGGDNEAKEVAPSAF